MATGKGVKAAAERAAQLSREMDRERAESGRIEEQLRELQRKKRDSAKRQRQQWQGEMDRILGDALEPVLARLRERIGDEPSEDSGARLLRAVAGITEAVGTARGCDRVLDALGVGDALAGRNGAAGERAGSAEAQAKAKPDGKTGEPEPAGVPQTEA